MVRAFRRTKYEKGRPKKVKSVLKKAGGAIRTLVTIGFGITAIKVASNSMNQ